jgi:hypothetical protein
VISAPRRGFERPSVLYQANVTGSEGGIGYGVSPEFTVKRIASVVDHLAEHGLLYSHKVKPYAPSPGQWGRSSSFMATDLLRAKLQAPPLMQRPDDVIWLRDAYGRRLMVPDTREVQLMRERMKAYNDFMADVEVALPGVPFDGVRYHVSAGGESWVVYPTPMLGRRVFNETFERGGRIYGLWPQQLPMRDAPVRRGLTITGSQWSRWTTTPITFASSTRGSARICRMTPTTSVALTGSASKWRC